MSPRDPMRAFLIIAHLKCTPCTGQYRERKKIKKPRSLAQVSEQFLHNFFSQVSSICTMQGRKSRAPSQRPMLSQIFVILCDQTMQLSWGHSGSLSKANMQLFELGLGKPVCSGLSVLS